MASFDTISSAGQTVSDIIAAAILPSAMEIMDRLSVVWAEAAVHPNYLAMPGLAARGALWSRRGGYAADEPRAQDVQTERCLGGSPGTIRAGTAAGLEGRKPAFAAAGRLAPNYIVQDGVIPRTKLPEVLEAINRTARQTGLRVTNVFHAGGGNFHPIV